MTEEQAPEEYRQPTQRSRWVISAIILLAAAARLYRIGEYSLWLDEVDTLYAGLHQIYFHPPLFLFATVAWSPLGINDGMLRLLPVLTGVLAVALIWRLTSRIAGRQAGIYAALLLALSPPAVHYSRELRMYVAMIALTLLSWSSLLSYIGSGRRGALAGAVLFMAALLYTHNYGVFVIAGLALSVTVLPPFRQSAKRALLAMTLTGVIYLPFFLSVVLFFSTRVFKAHYWAASVSWRSVYDTLLFLAGSYEPPMVHRKFLLLATLGLALWGVIRCPRRELRIVGLFGTAVPISLAIGLSLALPTSIFVSRYVSFAIGPLLVCAGAGLAAISARSRRLLLAGGVAALQFWALTYQYTNTFPEGPTLAIRPRKEFRQSAAYVAQRFRDGDTVAYTCESGALPAWYYLTYRNGLPTGHLVDLGGEYHARLSDKYNLDETVKQYPFIFPVPIDQALDGYKRVWLYATQWNLEGAGNDFYSKHRRAVIGWMKARYTLLEQRPFYGVDVYLFDIEQAAANPPSLTTGVSSANQQPPL